MPTLVCFHAHPDDECIATGGVMARAAADGHRVVLVVATRGEHGEVADGFLADGEELWQRRVEETQLAAEVLGVQRVEFLGYRDSGMMGTPENDLDGSFWSADVEEAAARLAAILAEERADVLTVYDDNGGYGHPDHIQVHRVGVRAAELAGTRRTYQATINRDHMLRLMRENRPPDMEQEDLERFEADESFGVSEDRITCRVDVTDLVGVKRAAMKAHASQIPDDHFMLAMPDEAFAMAFGIEWFIRDGQGPGITETAIIYMGADWSHTGYAQRIVFGAGALRQLPELLRSIGARRVLLVTTEGRLASDDGARVRRTLGADLASTFAEVESHVPAPLALRAVEQARADAVDAVVSFGGGSCADLGKAVCFFTEQQAGIPSTSWADRPALPHVSIPTTYSGAELTPFFGMTDPATRTKSGGGGPTIAPIAAVYDPELTTSTPPKVSAETGMNALAHCVEVVWSPMRTPEAEAIALAGARRIVSALPLVVDDPGDVSVRASMLEGAVLGGRCLQNASMGVHHGLAQLVGGRTGIPHGLANAVILPHAIRFNADVAADAVARLGEAMGVDDVAGAVAALVARLGLPTQLADCGVTLDDIDAIASQAEGNRNIVNNPKPVSAEDALGILSAAY